ncbi:MAG TPA: AbrB/MazE/SpoVT family DNA-binding domain-containing protein [Tenericutes bacterium]|nr:AbrB/MazE/SpoVT family DNA-binding domain-containing protein [Mycoplasmatota bacterium]
MKATGIIRRIDELGRIVIPKEIRKTFRIKEGDSLEIYIENDENIVFKKHSLISKIEDMAQNFTDSVYAFIKHNIIITSKDEFIAVSGNLKKEILKKPISEYLENQISRRIEVFEKYPKEIKLTDNYSLTSTYIIRSIVINGDVEGLVICISNDETLNTNDEKIISILASFLIRYLEE